jgi:hypothetical protein
MDEIDFISSLPYSATGGLVALQADGGGRASAEGGERKAIVCLLRKEALSGGYTVKNTNAAKQLQGCDVSVMTLLRPAKVSGARACSMRAW